MSEAELRLVKAAEREFERSLNIIGRIADFGAFERFFRPEGKMGLYW
ncbi:hypothetical protein AB9N12_06775 [Bacteroides sp. AN502(2024)]